MKKIVALLLVAVMCLSFVACGGGEIQNTNDDSHTNPSEHMNNETTQSNSENTESPYANHSLLSHLYGEWETTTEGNSFTSFTINEDGSCIVDGKDATWKIDEEYTSEENLCIEIHNSTEYLGGVMVWGSNLGVSGVASNHSFSSNNYEKVTN